VQHPDAQIELTPFSVTAARRFDALAIAVLIVTGVIAAATFRDYGLGWDDYTHSQYGSLLVSLFASGFADKRAFSFVNLYMYGGGFDLIAALAAKISPFGLFATRRLVGAAVGLIGLFVTWRLGRRIGGPLAGLIAVTLLAACPLYYGHMFINAKDGPFATTSAIALLGIVRAFQEYPRPTPATVALCGIGIGLAVGSRVMGGFAVIDAALPLPLILALRSRAASRLLPSQASGAGTAESAFGEMGLFLVALIPGAILAYLVMGLVWPWSVVDPANPFHAVEYFSRFFEKPWRELFDGQLIYAPDMPRSYVPTLIALKFPELLLALGSCGTLGAMAATVGWRSNRLGIGRRAALLAVVLAATLPVLATIVARPAMYNGIRHFVFVVPPFAVLGGLAAAWAGRHLQRHGALAAAAGILVMVAGIASPVVGMVRLHPFQYTYFNNIAGGVAGARPRYMLDYWGLSLTQASRQLLAFVASSGETPSGPKWRVAVCGPTPPVEIALGPQYTSDWVDKGVDFALVLGEFYCAKLDAPVVSEVSREGVVYARVYDIRGRSIPTLLAVPGMNK
jgi:hypothetical protein